MLSLDQIRNAIIPLKSKYDLKHVDVFGSYADGSATDESDLDLLVEFETNSVSLILQNALKYELETALGIPVDVVHAPIPVDSIIQIKRTLRII